MPFNFPSPSIATDNIKMRWREPYVSAGLNKKSAGITASGIYRGFIIATHGSNNTVQLTADPTKLDHLAVAEDTSGFSLTYRDLTGSAYVLALTDASLYSQTVVITLLLNFDVGSATTGTFRAYTLAEWLALADSSKSELVVIGTVINPGSGNVIPEDNITSTYRTVAAFSQPVLSWQPALLNSRFARSYPNGEVAGLGCEGWISQGDFWTSTSDVQYGSRCLEFKIATLGTKSSKFIQRVGCAVYDKVAVKFSKKVISVATGGTARITLQWGDDGGDYGGSDTIAFPIDATDAAYVTTTAIIDVPSGITSLLWVGIEFSSAVYAASGVKVRFGEVQVLTEPSDSFEQGNAADARMRSVSTTALVLDMDDLGSYSYADEIAAVLTFDKTSPASTEGKVKIGRRDGAVINAPALELLGRLTGLGSSLLSTKPNSLKPRISAPVSTTATANFTLLWESIPSGLKGLRLYAGDLDATSITEPAFFFTVNASYDGTNWNKDVTSTRSVGVSIVADDVMNIWVKATPDAWISSAWVSVANFKDGTSTLSGDLDVSGGVSVGGELVVTDLITAEAGVEVGESQNVVLSGSGHVERGTRQFTFPVTLGTTILSSGSLTITTGQPGVNWAVSTVGYIALPPTGSDAMYSTITNIRIYSNFGSSSGTVTYEVVASPAGGSGFSSQFAAEVFSEDNVHTYAVTLSGSLATGAAYWLKVTTNAALLGRITAVALETEINA